MAASSGGAPGSAGTTDVAVERIDEGAPGQSAADQSSAKWPTGQVNPPATSQDPNASGNKEVRNVLDDGKVTTAEAAQQVAQVDTSGHLIDPWTALKRANPTKF